MKPGFGWRLRSKKRTLHGLKMGKIGTDIESSLSCSRVINLSHELFDEYV